MMDLMELVRTRAQWVKNPSRRIPERETYFNSAGNVERQLQEDSHKVWGWVIYRGTYGINKDWDEFMNRLHFYIYKTLGMNNGFDMLDNLDYQVFEDRALFDGAHPSVIREHFERWVATALQQEQGTETSQYQPSQRYNYCLHVDKAALESVISGPHPSEVVGISKGFVNMICLHMWGGMRSEHMQGRDEQDCCWMQINPQFLIVTWFNLFREQGSWFTEYRVPPEVEQP